MTELKSIRDQAHALAQRIEADSKEIRITTPEDSAKLFRAESTKWSKVIREAAIKAN